LKLRLFKVGIVSILAYGVESWWCMTEGIKRVLRGWNSRCLHRLTGRSHRDECVDPTFDLVGHLLQRRQKWIRSLLDFPEESLPKRVFLAEAREHLVAGKRYQEGSLLAECPPHNSVEELMLMGGQQGEQVPQPPQPARKGQPTRKGLSDSFWLAAGYVLENGQWVPNVY
jgi:hypothetical protein